MTDTKTEENHEPINTEPPFIPDADVYDTHRPGEWVAIADTIYADVVTHACLEEYSMSFVALPTGKLWAHIQTGWRRVDRGDNNDA